MNTKPLYYEIYRRNAIGQTLVDVLDDLVTNRRIPAQLAIRILNNFDAAVAETLASKVDTRIVFKGSVDTYNMADEVFSCILNNFKFKPLRQGESEVTVRGNTRRFKFDGHDTVQLARVKMVACKAKEKAPRPQRRMV